MKAMIPIEEAGRRILFIRGQKVVLGPDLAELYDVETKALNQAVKRNKARFPEDFIFRLTPEEKREVVTKCDHLKNLKFSPGLPFAFTEHGAIMVAGILNTKRAIEVSVFVVRAFVRLREILASNKELDRKLRELEERVAGHDKHIRALFNAIRELMKPPGKTGRRIGFHRT